MAIRLLLIGIVLAMMSAPSRLSGNDGYTATKGPYTIFDRLYPAYLTEKLMMHTPRQATNEKFEWSEALHYGIGLDVFSLTPYLIGEVGIGTWAFVLGVELKGIGFAVEYMFR